MAEISTSVTGESLTLSDVTTNDVSTSKHGFAPKATGSTSNYLRADASYAAPAGGGEKIIYATDFESESRMYGETIVGSGTCAVTYGLEQETGTTSGSSAQDGWFLRNNGNVTTSSPYLDNPVLSCVFEQTQVGNANGPTSFIGIVQSLVTVNGTGHTFTVRHIGFKTVRAGGICELFATQANGTTETASSALATVAQGDSLEIYAKHTTGTNVVYNWRRFATDWSTDTTLTTNMPTNDSGGSLEVMQFSVSNNSTTSGNTRRIMCATYRR